MPRGKEDAVHISLRQLIANLIQKPKYVEGVLAQVVYVGAQIMCWTYIYQYAEAIGLTADEAGNYQFIAFISFFLGRFICTYLLKFFQSGKLLMLLSVLAVFFTLSTIFITGMVGLYSLVMISFCMSLMFPTIYGIALHGLTEDESKIGAAGLVMAIVGGALMPTLQGIILDIGGPGLTDRQILGVSEVNFSFILPLFCFIYIAWFGKSVIFKVGSE